MRLWIAIKMTIVLTLLTGIIYPVAMVALAHVFFPWQSSGSLVIRNGQVIGSALVGQNFSSDKYFHNRPSAAGDKGYDASSSSGSNLGPTNKALIDNVKKRLKDELETDPGTPANRVPVDLVTASGSGLDPEISPAAAQISDSSSGVYKRHSNSSLTPDEYESRTRKRLPNHSRSVVTCTPPRLLFSLAGSESM